MAFAHFEHHWFEWTPRESRIEAIEALAVDLPAGKTNVVVFTTERAAPKRQTFYVNDPRMAALGYGLYRPMSFTMTGSPGFARGMHVRFAYTANRRIDWAMTFAPQQALRRASDRLADQSGHDAERHLILFLRGRDAASRTNALRIGNVDDTLSKHDNRTVPFPPAYSANIFVGTIGYGSAHLTREPARIVIDGATFSPSHASGKTFVSAFEAGQTRTLTFDKSGDLQSIRVSADRHVMRIAFKPALRGSGIQTSDTAAFDVSFDTFTDQLSGLARTCATRDGLTVDFHVAEPVWARGTLTATLRTIGKNTTLTFFRSQIDHACSAAALKRRYQRTTSE